MPSITSSCADWRTVRNETAMPGEMIQAEGIEIGGIGVEDDSACFELVDQTHLELVIVDIYTPRPPGPSGAWRLRLR